MQTNWEHSIDSFITPQQTDDSTWCC